MDLIEPSINCIAGTGLVFGLAFVAVIAALFIVRWIDQMEEGLEEEAARD